MWGRQTHLPDASHSRLLGTRPGAASGWRRIPPRGASTIKLASFPAAVLILLLNSTVSANLVVSPYWSFWVNPVSLVQKSDCSVVKVYKQLDFNKPSGVVRGSGSTKSPYCPNATSGNEGNWLGTVILYKNLTFKSKGLHTVNVSWAFRFTEQWFVVPFKSCALNYSAKNSACNVIAGVGISVVPTLTDLSNSTWGNGVGFVSGSWVRLVGFGGVQNFSSTRCSAGKCSVSSSNTTFGNLTGNQTLTLNANQTLYTGALTMPSTDRFQLSLDFSIDIWSNAYSTNAHTTGKGKATASVNMATLNRYARLLSIYYR